VASPCGRPSRFPEHCSLPRGYHNLVHFVRNSKGPEAAEGTKESEEDLSLLRQARVIVGPWMMAVPGWGEGLVRPEIAREILHSPADKVLIPSREEGWEWAGVDLGNRPMLVRQAARAVRQILEGESVEPSKPLGAGAIIAIVLGVLVLLAILGIPLIYIF